MNVWSGLTSAFKTATSSKRRNLGVLDVDVDVGIIHVTKAWDYTKEPIKPELHNATRTHTQASFRSWRDSGLTWLAMAGLGVDKFSRHAGHDVIQTTRGYVRQAEELIRDLGMPFSPLPELLVRGSVLVGSGEIVANAVSDQGERAGLVIHEREGTASARVSKDDREAIARWTAELEGGRLVTGHAPPSEGDRAQCCARNVVEGRATTFAGRCVNGLTKIDNARAGHPHVDRTRRNVGQHVRTAGEP